MRHIPHFGNGEDDPHDQDADEKVAHQGAQRPALLDGAARAEEETGADGAGEGDHLDVPLVQALFQLALFAKIRHGAPIVIAGAAQHGAHGGSLVPTGGVVVVVVGAIRQVLVLGGVVRLFDVSGRHFGRKKGGWVFWEVPRRTRVAAARWQR